MKIVECNLPRGQPSTTHSRGSNTIPTGQQHNGFLNSFDHVTDVWTARQENAQVSALVDIDTVGVPRRPQKVSDLIVINLNVGYFDVVHN
jgi:hypothetical protein